MIRETDNTSERSSPSRKTLILEALANMLEQEPQTRVTISALAKAVGVTDAALYKHYASKNQMFEGLISFTEDVVFSRIHQVIEEQASCQARIEHITRLMLTFAFRNPGISRILCGDALCGEDPRLMLRVSQIFNRLEVQIKQLLRNNEHYSGIHSVSNREKLRPECGANIIVVFIEGKIHQFVRSGYELSPLNHFEVQWKVLVNSVFK